MNTVKGGGVHTPQGGAAKDGKGWLFDEKHVCDGGNHILCFVCVGAMQVFPSPSRYCSQPDSQINPQTSCWVKGIVALFGKPTSREDGGLVSQENHFTQISIEGSFFFF